MTDRTRPVAPRRVAVVPFGRIASVSERVRARLDPTLDRLRAASSATDEPYEESRSRVHAQLWRAALFGLAGVLLITVGASQYGSPFTLKLPGAWLFGIPPAQKYPGPLPADTWEFLGIVAVYSGMLLLTRAWYDLVRTTSRHRGVPLRPLALVFCAWIVPLFVVAPLFSHDLYSYACQGQMMTIHGANPYDYGCSTFGVSPIYSHVDDLWKNVTSPYGPVFLVLGGWIVTLAHHNLFASLTGFRLLALLGTVLLAVAIPDLARSFGRDRATAFALAVLNPLILLNLIGGGHNDALMVGLLAAGFALARRGHLVVGIVVCALGAVVKVPAIVGVAYIGWEWAGVGRPARERVLSAAKALVIALAVVSVATVASGLGWGWISGLSNPDAIRSWLDPATGLGLAAGKLAAALGHPSLEHSLLTVARGGAMLIALLLAVRLLWRSEEIGPLHALGWTLFAFAVLGPVVQPWYLAWGFVFLAPVAEGLARYVLCVLSAASCFLGLPGGVVLVDQLGQANPVPIAVASIALVALCALLVVPRVRRLREGAGTLSAVAGTIAEEPAEALSALGGATAARSVPLQQ